MLLSALSASSLGRGESKPSSFRYGSDSSFPWGLHVSYKFQVAFTLTLADDANSTVSKALSGPGYLHFLWNKRTYAIAMWVCDEKSLYLSFETDKFQTVLQIHHFSGNYYILQLFHLPRMQNLFILVLIHRFPWASFQNFLLFQLPPPKMTHLCVLEIQGNKEPKQLLQLLLLHRKSSTYTLKNLQY